MDLKYTELAMAVDAVAERIRERRIPARQPRRWTLWLFGDSVAAFRRATWTSLLERPARSGVKSAHYSPRRGERSAG